MDISPRGSYFNDDIDPTRVLRFFLAHRYSLPELRFVSETPTMKKLKNIKDKIKYLLSEERHSIIFWNTPIMGTMNLRYLRYGTRVQIRTSSLYAQNERQQFTVAFSYNNYGENRPQNIKVYASQTMHPIKRNLFTMLSGGKTLRYGCIGPNSDIVFMLSSTESEVIPLYLELKPSIFKSMASDSSSALCLTHIKNSNCIFHLESPFPGKENYGRLVQFGEPVILRHKRTSKVLTVLNDKKRHSSFGEETPLRLTRTDENVVMHESKKIFYIMCGIH